MTANSGRLIPTKRSQRVTQTGRYDLHIFLYFSYLSSAVFFSKLTLSKFSFRSTVRVPNSSDPDQARHVGPIRSDQGKTADDTGRENI